MFFKESGTKKRRPYFNLMFLNMSFPCSLFPVPRSLFPLNETNGSVMDNVMNINVDDNEFIGDILIVDDKVENIGFLSDFLTQYNYQVRKAINGKAALKAVKALPPDLILLDINMPGMGGYEVCECLKQDINTAEIPVIFLSAGSEVADKLRAFQVGGIDYITKPFQLDEVLVRVKTHLTLQKLQQERKAHNQELQNMLLALQNAQAELIQKEKLVNAGRITAGISHEINNPLSFIFGNIEPAREYSQQLINLIRLYQKSFPEATPEIRHMIEEIDLDFLIPDFIKAINSIYTGAERISLVVNALHSFSRLDESGIKPINLIENIESVLTILRYQFELKADSVNISIIKEYAEMPTFMGYANLFNQALQNLLQNAIDALESKINLTIDSLFVPTIWIMTETTAQQTIKISIKDNGIGISPESESHLFDPFFTTKLIGKGVGIGLFTSHQIITELHKGTLIYNRDSEERTEFIMEIPF